MDRRRRSVAWLVVAFAVLASLSPLGGAGGAVDAVDELAHALGAAVVTIVLAWGFDARRGRRLVAVVALVIAGGAAVELLQWPLPWRTASASDLAADAVGAAIVGALWWLWERRPEAGAG